MQDSSNPSRRERKKLRNQLKKASEVALPPQKRRILEEVALSPDVEDEGERRFTIGHQYYNDSLCSFKVMKPSYLRKVLEGYKNMSRCITEAEIYDLPMDIKRIPAKSHYKKYISKVTPETELSEFDAGKYRGFFFIDRAEKIIQMLAVDIHPENKKNKR